MEEKILRLLKGGKLSIEEIQDKLGDVRRQEIAVELQQLKSKGIISRSLDYGKAYYSLNDIKEEFEFKYDEGLRFENDKYSIEIPDSFIKVDKENREFVYYLPNGEEEDYDNGGAHIIIYSSSYFDVPSGSIKNIINDVSAALYEFTFYTAGYKMFLSFGGKPEFKIVDLNMGKVCMILMRFDSQYNFYFVCPLNGEYKQIRIVIDGDESKNEMENMAISLMNKFIPKNVYDVKLNAEKYMVDNVSFIVSDYVNEIKTIDENVRVFFNLGVKSEVLRYKRNGGSTEEFTRKVKDRLTSSLELFDKYLEEAYEFICHARKNNSIDELLPIYYELNEFIKNSGELTINVRKGTTLKEASSLVQDLYFKIFDNNILRKIENYSDNKEEQINKKIEKAEPIQKIVEEKKVYDSKNEKEFFREKERIFTRLKRDWDSFKEEYADALNSKTIFSEYALKVEMINLKKTARSYGDRFEDIVIDIDKKAKEFVKNGANYNFIGEVVVFMDKIFDAFADLTLEFSSEGVTNLDLGTYSYDISDDVVRIRYYWKEEYDHHPDVLKYKNKQTEKNRNFGKGPNMINNFIYSLTDNVISEDEWAKEVEEIDILKKEALENLCKEIAEKYLKKEKKIKEEHSLFVGDLKENISRLEDINTEKHEKLAGLSSIKFRKKERLKSEVDSNIQSILKYENEIIEADRNYEKDIQKLKEREEEDLEDGQKLINKNYAYPANPNKLIEEVREILNESSNKVITKDEIENNKIMDDIVQELTYLAKPLTISEIMSLSDSLSIYSNQKLSSLLSLLVKEGRVVKKVVGKLAYFSVNDGTEVMYDDSDEVLDYPFAVDRKRILNLLKKGPKSFDSIDFDLGDLSKFRVMQVIKSLYDDDKVDIKVKKNDIIISLK